MTDIPEFDERRIAALLQPLTHCRRLAFAAACCERLLPNYRAFVRETNWGNFDILRKSVDIVWRASLGESFPLEEIEALESQCDEQAPNTEDFGTRLVSYALDTAVATATAVRAIGTPTDASSAAQVAYSARETPYMHADIDGGNTPEFWKKMLAYPYLRKEIAVQLEDISALASGCDLEAFRSNAMKRGSSIGISNDEAIE